MAGMPKGRDKEGMAGMPKGMAGMPKGMAGVPRGWPFGPRPFGPIETTGDRLSLVAVAPYGTGGGLAPCNTLSHCHFVSLFLVPYIIFPKPGTSGTNVLPTGFHIIT